ncbi:hypothetical protein ACQ86N_48655 [Puia sp. P3]|uniref:hypothetical protein n=1 Tax=Puia sp. P3 TaxID=3423952 RepID=UPI003D678EE0
MEIQEHPASHSKVYEVRTLRTLAYFVVSCSSSTSAYSRSLKRIAKQLNWTRNVFNKMARQTNPQLYIRFGATRSILAKMPGQEKEESDSHYFEVNVQEIIEGTKHIDFDRFDI